MMYGSDPASASFLTGGACGLQQSQQSSQHNQQQQQTGGSYGHGNVFPFSNGVGQSNAATSSDGVTSRVPCGTGNGWTTPYYLPQTSAQQLQQAYSSPQQLPSLSFASPSAAASLPQQQSQSVRRSTGWMEPAGPSNGFPTTSSVSPSTSTTTTANGGVHNGNGATPSFMQQFASTSAGLTNQQLLNAMVSAAGGISSIPTATSATTSNGNHTPAQLPSQLIAQQIAQKAAKQQEEYYNADRARASAANMAMAASHFYGGAGSSTSPQKTPKLEGLPAGIIPASGVRKPKQQRQPRADVAPGSVASAASPAGSSGAAGVTSLQGIANGQSVRRPDANATQGEIVAYLMQFNIQHAEADFSIKSLESLHKKIKDRPSDMETFMRAVETKGEVVGGCICVTRTLDGRLQVAGRKGFPHVIYTKIFRFQELHKNELKSIPACQYGFDNKLEDEKARVRHENGQRAQNGYLFSASNEEHKPDAQVCVNPYHYERVTAPSGGGSLIDPITGLLRGVNGLHSMDEMMDFASSASSHIKISPGRQNEVTRNRSSGHSGDWPLISIDDGSADEGEAAMRPQDQPAVGVIRAPTSSGDEAAPAPAIPGLGQPTNDQFAMQLLQSLQQQHQQAQQAQLLQQLQQQAAGQSSSFASPTSSIPPMLYPQQPRQLPLAISESEESDAAPTPRMRVKPSRGLGQVNYYSGAPQPVPTQPTLQTLEQEAPPAKKQLMNPFLAQAGASGSTHIPVSNFGAPMPAGFPTASHPLFDAFSRNLSMPAPVPAAAQHAHIQQLLFAAQSAGPSHSVVSTPAAAPQLLAPPGPPISLQSSPPKGTAPPTEKMDVDELSDEDEEELRRAQEEVERLKQKRAAAAARKKAQKALEQQQALQPQPQQQQWQQLQQAQMQQQAVATAAAAPPTPDAAQQQELLLQQLLQRQQQSLQQQPGPSTSEAEQHQLFLQQQLAMLQQQHQIAAVPQPSDAHQILQQALQQQQLQQQPGPSTAPAPQPVQQPFPAAGLPPQPAPAPPPPAADTPREPPPAVMAILRQLGYDPNAVEDPAERERIKAEFMPRPIDEPHPWERQAPPTSPPLTAEQRAERAEQDAERRRKQKEEAERRAVEEEKQLVEFEATYEKELSEAIDAQQDFNAEIVRRRQAAGLPIIADDPVPELDELLDQQPCSSTTISAKPDEERDAAILKMFGVPEEEAERCTRSPHRRTKKERDLKNKKNEWRQRLDSDVEEGPTSQEDFDKRIEFNIRHRMERHVAFNKTARKNPRDASPYFMHARPTMLESLGLAGNPPPPGGFGYQNLDIKPIIDKGESSRDASPKSANQLLEAVSYQAALSASQSRERMEDQKLVDKMIRERNIRSEITDSSDGGNDMFNNHYNYESEMSESESTKQEIDNITVMLLAAGAPLIAENGIEFERDFARKKLEEMKKARDEAEKESLHSDDSEYGEKMMMRQKRNKDIVEQEKKSARIGEEFTRIREARGDVSPETITVDDDATIWTGHYIDNQGKPSYSRDRRWRGEPPNTRVTVGAIGSGTYGSKGPHLKPRQHLRNMEMSLQQLSRTLEAIARCPDFSGAQYMILCQHYAGMIPKTEAANSNDEEQIRFTENVHRRVKELMGGEGPTYQQLSAWDINRLFQNHIKTLPERREEEAARRKRGEMGDMETEWTFEISEELNKIIAETKGTDAEGIFTKKQIERAMKARERIINGEKIIPDELMEVEELKSPFARALEERKKRKREEAGLDAEAQPDPLLPLLPMIENSLTSDDLQQLFDAPSEYMKTFRDYVLEQKEMGDVNMEEIDESTRGVVPPREGDAKFQPFDGRERENDEPDDHGEERPPLKRNCVCPDDEKKKQDHCSWGKHHHYNMGVSKEIVDAAFILYRYRIQRKKSKGGEGELYHFANKFNCPNVCLTRTTEIEPHSAKWKPEHYKWCAVQYGERQFKVGNLHQVEEVNYFIDGGFECSTEQRLCIGSMTCVDTMCDTQVREIRSKIGCGVRLSCKEDGSMWVRVLSRYPIFVQSAFLDREAGQTTGDAIHKIYPGTAVKVFDLHRSRETILQMYDYQCEAAKLHAGEKKCADLPYPLCRFNRRELRAISRLGGDDMQRYCLVKIGFCKGWGPEFESKTIIETPCWAEIVLNRACEFIDHCMNLREVSYAFSELDSSDYDD